MLHAGLHKIIFVLYPNFFKVNLSYRARKLKHIKMCQKYVYHVLCLMSFNLCIMSYVLCLITFFYVLCIICYVLCLMSYVLCLMSYCLMSYVLCLVSYVLYPLYVALVTCNMWHVTSDMSQVICDMWHETHPMWHMTCDMWHVTWDMYYVTCDMCTEVLYWSSTGVYFNVFWYSRKKPFYIFLNDLHMRYEDKWVSIF